MTRYKPPSSTKREYKKIASTTAKAGISSLPLSQSTPLNAPQPQRPGPVTTTTQLLSDSHTSQWLPPFRSNSSVTSTEYIAPIRPPMLIPSYPTPLTLPLAPNTPTTATTYSLPPHPASNAALWEPHNGDKAAQTTNAVATSSVDLTSYLTKAVSTPSKSTPS